jgi:hypothetical protein
MANLPAGSGVWIEHTRAMTFFNPFFGGPRPAIAVMPEIRSGNFLFLSNCRILLNVQLLFYYISIIPGYGMILKR